MRLLFAVGFNVVLGSVLGVLVGMDAVGVGQVSMMGSCLVIPFGVVPGGFAVVARSVLVMFRCIGVMFGCMLGHGNSSRLQIGFTEA